MKETSKIYVDIESLLDVRGAILLQLLKKDELTTYLNSEEYNFRQIDKFSVVNQEDYDRINSNKTVDLIPFSVVTHILISLKSKLSNLEKRNNFYNEKKIPEVILNVYPFKFSESQMKALQNMLFVKLDTNTLVNVINFPPKEVSPYFISTNGIITCFIYNFKEWMNHHSASLEKTKLPDVLLYFPALFFETPDQKELKRINDLGFKDLFSYTEYLFSTVANVNFLPAVFYSNLVTASLYLDKFNDVLKDEPLSKDSEEEKGHVDSSTKV